MAYSFLNYQGSMDTPRKADPAVYVRLRQQALEKQLPNLPRDTVHIVLMDWHVGNGTATVLAAADGTASLYLSSGGGFLGGGQRYPAIRATALRAVTLAGELLAQFEPAESFALPDPGAVFFYVTTGAGVRFAAAAEARLRAGTDPLAVLGGVMQRIVTEYRLLRTDKPPAKETTP